MPQPWPDDARPPILLLGPSALPTGASLTLLALLRWTRRTFDPPPRAALLASGPLADDFRSAGAVVLGANRSPVHVAERTARRLGQPKVAKVLRMARHAPLHRRPPRPRVVFASTVQAAGPSLRFLGPDVRLAIHAFEPGELLDELVNPTMMARLADRTTLWMAASEEVAAGLEARGVPDHRVVVVPPFLDVPDVDPPAIRRMRADLGVADGDVVVGGVGRSDWRDGPDVFIRMAARLRRHRPDLPVRFVWVGAPHDGPSRWILDHDVRHARLSDVFDFVGEPGSVGSWIGAFDVLAQTSRVDPASPAGLIAGALGVPTVAFSAHVGRGRPPAATEEPSPEGTAWLDHVVPPDVDDRGVELLPYLDVESLAARVAELAGDPATRASSSALRRRRGPADGHVDDRAAALWELLETTAYGRPRPEGEPR